MARAKPAWVYRSHQSLRDVFVDGVFFVSLAPINDPMLVMPTIAQAIGIQDGVGQPLSARLAEVLHQKQVLLLLDNFEQVVGAASQVADLLTSCPQLKVLVTSREVLRVRAEHEFAVPPLELPDPAHLPEPVALARAPSVALFLQRAAGGQARVPVDHFQRQSSCGDLCSPGWASISN